MEISKITNTETPLVSIICITYNQDAYIGDCMNGFLMQQTNFPFEVLVHDDFSTDNTLNILKGFQSEHPEIIRLFTEDSNQFGRFSFTKMLNNQARGKYLAYCEGDDYWIDPFKLQRQVDCFRSNPGMTICFSNRIVKNEKNGVVRITNWPLRKYFLEDFLSGFNPGIQTMCFIKETLSDSDIDFGWQNHINGDRMIPISCTKKGFALCVPNVSGVYRVTGKGISTSISQNGTDEKWFSHVVDDIYHFHEVYGFPSKMAYVRGVTAYTFNFIKKTGRIVYGIKKVARYNTSNRIAMSSIVCWSLFKYLCGRICFYVNQLLGTINKLCFQRFVTRQFDSIVFECQEDNAFNLTKQKVIKSIWTPRINVGNKAVTIADAFLYANGEQMSLFYELQDAYKAKGILMETKTKDGINWSEPIVALEEDFHLSFPNVFDMDGETWMLPETYQAGQVRLYRKDKETNKFKQYSVLVDGGKYVDSFIYKKDNVYYLSTSLQHSDNSYDQLLFVSNRIDGDYKPHPMSPLSHGKAYQRNAGRIIEYDGKIYRPAQESTAFYGQDVHIMEITELSKERYKEVPYKLNIIPKSFGVGGHQYSECVFKGKHYVAIDILHNSINTHVIWNRLIKKFAK